MKILLLSKFERLGASSRMRALQYLPSLEARGYEVSVRPLISNKMLSSRYKKGGYSKLGLLSAYLNRIFVLLNKRNFDVVWIEKEALPWWPVWIELLLLRGVPYVLDYDDAVFHNYDRHRNIVLRLIFGSRLDRLMKEAALVVGGNRYLAQRAIDAGASCVEVLPTVIDLNRYPSGIAADVDSVPRIVWVGSPSTAHYLNLLRDSLSKLAEETPFVLRIIGAESVDIPGVHIEYVRWTEDTEVKSISSCAVGIMPLENSPWEKGKCGYKIIQYMACSLPVVASDIGVNVEIVENGVSGYLARSPEDWIAGLRVLLATPRLRHAMGKSGRLRVEKKYCLQNTGPRLINLLLAAANKNKE